MLTNGANIELYRVCYFITKDRTLGFKVTHLKIIHANMIFLGKGGGLVNGAASFYPLKATSQIKGFKELFV